MKIDTVIKTTQDGYGFDITDDKNHPVVRFSYSSMEDAQDALVLLEEAIDTAVSVIGYSRGTA